MADRLYSHVLGCMVGSALGDAWGAVVEGASAERVAETLPGATERRLLPDTRVTASRLEA